MSRDGWLPPGVADADIDRAAPGYDDDNDQQRYEYETQHAKEHAMDDDVNDVFRSKYLQASDLKNREHTVTIEDVDKIELTDRSGKKAIKLLITFEGRDRGLISNKTNANRISQITGTTKYSQWVGREITLYVDPFVEFGGELKPAIRVKAPPTAPKPKPGPQSQAEIDPMPDQAAKPAPRKPAATYDEANPPPAEPEDDDVFGDRVPF